MSSSAQSDVNALRAWFISVTDGPDASPVAAAVVWGHWGVGGGTVVSAYTEFETMAGGTCNDVPCRCKPALTQLAPLKVLDFGWNYDARDATASDAFRSGVLVWTAQSEYQSLARRMTSYADGCKMQLQRRRCQ